MSKIITIGEHRITIPTPTDKGDILFAHQNKHNAYWQRLGPNDRPIEEDPWPEVFLKFLPYVTKINQKHTYLSDDGYFETLNEDDTKLVDRLFIRELHRRKNGVHIKNGDKIIWMPGDYYANLQWIPMHGLTDNNGFGYFRWFQNDYLIVQWYAQTSKIIGGVIVGKPKKTGITQIIAGAFLNQSSMISKKEFLMMSKTGPDVVDTNMMMFFYGYDQQPWIFKPQQRKRSEAEIVFAKPVGRTTGTRNTMLRQAAASGKKSLDTRVAAMPTKASGFDGPLVYLGWVDEWVKTWESSTISVEEMYKKTIETVFKQQVKHGTLIYSSYTIESDDRGFYEGKKIWDKSKLETVDPETGRTESKMITHAISVKDAFEGHFDKYGKCDHVKVTHLVTQALNNAKETSDKQRLKRQYPMDENDMWDSGGGGSTFDNIRLAIRKRIIETFLRQGDRPFMDGRYRWTNSLWETGVERPKGEFAPVEFEPLTDEEIISGKTGRIRIYQDIPEEMRNRVLQRDHRHEEDGALFPFQDNEIVGSFDPTDYVLKKDVAQGSKFAGHTMNLFNPATNLLYKGVASKVIMSEYLYRADNPDENYEDLVKEIIYTGKQVIIEANKAWVITFLKKDLLHWFLLLRQKNGIIAPYELGQENDLVHTTTDIIEAYCRAIARYIKKAMQKGDIDYLDYVKSVELIDQLMNFDPTNTKKFDLVVSLGYCLLALESFSVFKENQAKEINNAGEKFVQVVEALLNL